MTKVDGTSGLASYFRPGVLFIEINDVKATTLRAAKKAKRNRGTDKLYVYDKGRFMFLAVKSEMM